MKVTVFLDLVDFFLHLDDEFVFTYVEDVEETKTENLRDQIVINKALFYPK